MRTLQETLDKLSDAGGVGQSLRKHFNAVGITEWGDFTRSALYDLKDHLAEKLAPGTQKT